VVPILKKFEKSWYRLLNEIPQNAQGLEKCIKLLNQKNGLKENAWGTQGEVGGFSSFLQAKSRGIVYPVFIPRH
jgi:hypothetical protein